MAFAVASHFTPMYDLSGVPVPHGASLAALSLLTLNVTPDAEGTLISLAVPHRHAEALRSIVARFERATDDEDFIGCAWELALRSCENLVLSPAAWAVLPEGPRRGGAVLPRDYPRRLGVLDRRWIARAVTARTNPPRREGLSAGRARRSAARSLPQVQGSAAPVGQRQRGASARYRQVTVTVKSAAS